MKNLQDLSRLPASRMRTMQGVGTRILNRPLAFVRSGDRVSTVRWQAHAFTRL